ncbi:MAG: hypothetical protein AseanaTS_28400 [Candidatus Pelagadaptatus aseana]|uniref:chaperone NapD n=1 Tax=Candidatus Pelagadaptatus aseana TaxID=3120508 RepID=UPI0039B2A557
MNPVQIQECSATSEASEWHIASLVAYCQPERFMAVKQFLDERPHIELHTDDGSAKMILTIEGKSTAELSEQMDELNANPDFMSLQMVFHQHDQSDSAEQPPAANRPVTVQPINLPDGPSA